MDPHPDLRRNTSIAALCAGLSLCAAAQDIEPFERISAVAIAAVSAQLPPNARVSASVPDPRLRLPACAQAPVAAPPAARSAHMSVAVRCADPAWTVYVPVHIRDLRPVLVLTRTGTRGEPLSATLLGVQERDVMQLPFGYFEDIQALEGYVLRRTLPPGAVLTPYDAEPPRLVRRGQTVTVIGRSGGIEVRAAGTALSDASHGERVRVRNDRSQRIVEGTVTAAGVVEIRL